VVDPAPLIRTPDLVVQGSGFPARHGFSTAGLGSMGLTSAADPDGVLDRRRRLAGEVGFDLGRAVLAV